MNERMNEYCRNNKMAPFLRHHLYKQGRAADISGKLRAVHDCTNCPGFIHSQRNWD